MVDIKRYVVMPDLHAPYHDRSALSCVLRAIEMLRPDGFINLGDVAEGESVSHWQWKKKRRPPIDMQLELYVDPEIVKVNQVLDQIDESLDKAGVKEKIFIQGNHDEWWDRMVEENSKLAVTAHPCGVGYGFKDAFQLIKRGYKFYPIGEKCRIGRLYFYHGHHFSGKHHAHNHLINMGVNVVYGHHHDVQNATVSHVDGKKGAWSLGCLKSFKHEHANQWLQRRNTRWDHAFGLVSFYKNGFFNVDTIMIINGRCVVNGQVIDGNSKKKRRLR